MISEQYGNSKSISGKRWFKSFLNTLKLLVRGYKQRKILTLKLFGNKSII